MKRDTAIILGASALTGGALWWVLRNRGEQSSTQQAGLVLTPSVDTVTIPSRYQPVPGITATEPTAAALIEARRCFILFIEAYSRYHFHHLPYDLSTMQALSYRLNGRDYDWITRQDVWAYSDYDWLLQDAEVYFGPEKTFIQDPLERASIYRLTDRRMGGVYVLRTMSSHYINWKLPLRTLMARLLDEARAGKTIPAARALLLPFITTAPDGSWPWVEGDIIQFLPPASRFQWEREIVPAMREFWSARGRSLAVVGTVTTSISSPLSSGPVFTRVNSIWTVK